MAFSFNFGGKTWWVARSISGYVTRAFEGGTEAEDKADYEADGIDEAIFYNEPVGSDSLSSGIQDDNLTEGWRLLGVKKVGSEEIMFYIFDNAWGRIQKKPHDSVRSAFLWLATEKLKRQEQSSINLPKSR